MFSVLNSTLPSEITEESVQSGKVFLAQKLLLSYIDFAHEKDKLKKEISSLKSDLHRDDLTSCYNRKWLIQKFTQSDKLFVSSGFLVLIDLDNFKAINDTYGHVVGDDALRFISSQLKGLNKNMSVVRIGGDEFCLVSNKTEVNFSVQYICDMIGQLREKILKKHFVIDTGYLIRVGFFYGASPFKEGDSFSDVLSVADGNMYKNKTKNKEQRTKS